MRATHGLSKLTAHHVATAFDLSPFTSACHLGGTSLHPTGVGANGCKPSFSCRKLQVPHLQIGFPGGRIRKQFRRPRFNPWVGKIPWRREWQPTPVFLPGESPWTEEPGGLQFMGLQSQTGLSN